MRPNIKRRFETSIGEVVSQFRQTGKIGDAKRKDITEARKSALAKLLQED